MNFKLDKILQEKQINLFLVLSFFFIFLSFVISKGFINNEELSDKFFLISSVCLLEIIYLTISNKYINFQINNLKDHTILFTFFLLIYLIWNSESILSYLYICNYNLLFIIFDIKNIL